MSDSYNHVFLQSYNSFNRDLISGGSSGGEGALVGCRGSIVGIGSDIGGSIRIPSNLQGLYGLCPSVGRVPYESQGYDKLLPHNPRASANVKAQKTRVYRSSGCRTNCNKSFHDRGVHVGPPFIRTLDCRSHDLPIPWRCELTQPPNRPLKIGYYLDDGMVKVQPPLERAVREVVDKLKAAGHEGML